MSVPRWEWVQREWGSRWRGWRVRRSSVRSDSSPRHSTLRSTLHTAPAKIQVNSKKTSIQEYWCTNSVFRNVCPFLWQIFSFQKFWYNSTPTWIYKCRFWLQRRKTFSCSFSWKQFLPFQPRAGRAEYRVVWADARRASHALACPRPAGLCRRWRCADLRHSHPWNPCWHRLRIAWIPTASHPNPARCWSWRSLALPPVCRPECSSELCLELETTIIDANNKITTKYDLHDRPKEK